MSSKQLVWLVTGTSSGFGRELVFAALARGEKVIATARTTSIHKLEELRAKGAAVLELDAAWPKDKLKEVVEKAESIYGRIDVLFNNAGYASYRSVEESTPEEDLDIFNANVFGGLNLARAVLPGMRARKEGTILWNGSLLGIKPGVGVGLYGATKASVRVISQVLHDEISPLGLRSIVVDPGFFRTLLIDNVERYKSRIEDYEPLLGPVWKAYNDFNAVLPGDPKRGVEVILDLIRGEGGAQGREVPKTIPLGTDCFEAVESVSSGALAILKDWKEVIVSTDFPK